MTEQTPRGLVELLRSSTLRCRTGILTVPQELLGEEADLAARLGIDALDYVQLLLAGLPQGTSFVNINDETEGLRVHDLAKNRSDTNCLMVCNLDLALSKLDSTQRKAFWSNLLDRFPHYPCSLLVAMPSAAAHLMPPDADLARWEESGRLAHVVSPHHETPGDDNGSTDERRCDGR